MARFSQKSLEELETCRAELQRLFQRVVLGFDCTVLQGERDIEEQRRNVTRGVSKTLDSLHLTSPQHPKARAADVTPYPLKWPALHRDLAALLSELPSHEQKRMQRLVLDFAKQLALFYYFGGYVVGVAEEMGIALRWGADWDGDREITDQTFDDLGHFELRGI